MAFLAVFVALKIAHRAGGYAVWPWIPTICDLRRLEYHLVQLKKTVTTDFRGSPLGESDSRVRHDAVVFRPNGWHQRNANGEKPPKPGSFGIWGPPTKKVVGVALFIYFEDARGYIAARRQADKRFGLIMQSTAA